MGSSAPSNATRLLDVLLSGTLLVLCLPMILIIGVLVRLQGPGPIVFSQQRLGRHGRPFRLHKFRTLEPSCKGESALEAMRDDRISRLGRHLRSSKLDELPQLVDVLAGHMSLVGPRPMLGEDLTFVDSSDRTRLLSVRPGLTSRVALNFIAEDEVLVRTRHPEAVYRRCLVPAKVAAELCAERGVSRYLVTLLQTPAILLSRRARARSLDQVEALIRACLGDDAFVACAIRHE